MIPARSIGIRSLVYIGLFGLGAASVWGGGCSRPIPRATVNSPALPRQEETVGTDGEAAEFRLARDSELSRQREALQRLLESAQADETVRSEVEKEMWHLTRIEAAEHEAEAALAMQGWPEASISVIGDEATVVLHGSALTAQEAETIGRLVAAATGLAESSIRLVERP